MPTKPLPFIALVLLVPIALLAFFAARTFSLENEALSERRERLARQRMEVAATLVLTQLQNLGTDTVAQTQAAHKGGDSEALSKLARKRLFSYAFVFNSGTQIYSATALEHQYDSARVLQDKAQALANTLGPSQTAVAELVAVSGGYTLLRCSRDATSDDICIAIDITDVMDALRSAVGLLAPRTGLARAALIAPNGATISAAKATEPGLASRPLDGLLTGWQLRGEEPPSSNGSREDARPLYLIVGALIACWIAMTWMLHRSAVLKEEASVARANVIAQLAHELRTPLANLKLYTDLLRRKSSDAGAVRQYGVVLDDEIDRLTNLAENAIAVARGAMPSPRLETAVPDDCLRTILKRFEPTLSDARCGVRTQLNAGQRCSFDKTSWERNLVNLIDNARKYAPGSEIDIATTQASGVLRLEVSDRGPGIDANQREQIFEPLERGTTTTVSGFGLGLAAVRALARQNGGNCWVEALNPGARFVLTMRALPGDAAVQERTVS